MKKLLMVMAIAGLLVPLIGAGNAVEATTKPQLLTGILNKMEKAHQNLRSMRAELIQKKTNSQIGVTDSEYGQLLYKPAAGKNKGKLRIDYTRPTKDIIALVGENIVYYQPRINQVFKSSIAKASKGKVGGYANLVGLDGSLKSLAANYNIDFVKDETINGQMSTVLRLVPKSGSQFASIDVWVNVQTGLPTQWKMNERNGDYTLVILNNVEVNASIPDTAFNINIPSGTRVVDKI